MSVARRRGNPGKADMLHSRIVRSRGACQRCGQPGTDTAHIVRRRYSATRCLEDGSWCLCRPCHVLVDQWPHEFMFLVELTIGVGRYKALHAHARAGIAGSSALFWRSEVERLTARCHELGIDTKWRAA